MKPRILPAAALLSVTLAVLAPAAQAGRSTSFQFNGHGNWSIDAVGGNVSPLGTPVGTIHGLVPVGATVEKAFLYSSTASEFRIVPTVSFDGTLYTGPQWTDLGGVLSVHWGDPALWVNAFRADVTAQVAAKVGGGDVAPFAFTIDSESPYPGAIIDGEALAIVYSLPTEAFRTIAFLDGNSAGGIDSTTVAFSPALSAADLANPSFTANLSLAIGHSVYTRSTVDVNFPGNRLTSSAGGFDDGGSNVGARITAGGLGDDPANPAEPGLSTSPDDELYDLKPFLSAGQTSVTFLTDSPDRQENVFFLGINITAPANVIAGPVPDSGATLPLLAAGLLALAAFRRRSWSVA